MSYILDALKKAERERDVVQIPTLTTVHDMPAARLRRQSWVILGAGILCAGLLVWAGFLLLKPAAGPVSSGVTIRSAEQDKAVLTTIPQAEGPEADRKPALPSDGNHSAGVKQAPVHRQVQKPPTSPPAAKESIPQQAAPKTPVPETVETPPAPTKPMSLREAMAKMNMTILFYAEAKPERMVFINDRKYFEGDYIDGQYLLESITPEGAWLSYQGDRAILRAKSR